MSGAPKPAACPNCGKATWVDRFADNEHFVSCDQGTGGCFMNGPIGATEAEAVEKWNRIAERIVFPGFTP